MGAKILVIVAIAACSDPPGMKEPGVPIFEKFGLEQAEQQVRPYGCFEVQLGYAADRPIEADEIVWSSDSLHVVPFFYDQYLSVALVCARGTHGMFTYKVAMRDYPEYYASAKVQVTLPVDSNLWRVNPLGTIHGKPSGPPTRIFWSDDGKSIYVASEDQTLTRWSSTTLKLEKSWYTAATDAMPLDGGRVALPVGERFMAVMDLATSKLTTWLSGLGQEHYFAEHAAISAGGGRYQLRAVGGGGSRIASWEVRTSQNSNVCQVGFLDLEGAASTQPTPATNIGFPKSPDRVWVDVLRPGVETTSQYDVLGAHDMRGSPRPSDGFNPEYYTEVSPRGRFVAAAPGGCHGNGLMYDAQDKRFCGLPGGDQATWLHRGVFSANERAFANRGAGANYSIHVMRTDTCQQLGYWNQTFMKRLGLGFSPDGNVLATASDHIEDANGTQTRVVLYDVRPEAPEWQMTDPNFGGNPVRGLRVIYLSMGYRSAVAPNESMHRLAYSPDGKRIAVAAPNGRLAVIDLDQSDGAPIYDEQLPDTTNLYDFHLSPSKEYIWVTARSGDEPRYDRGVYDLDERRMLARYDASVTYHRMEDQSFVISRSGSPQLYRVSYANPSVEVPIASLDPAPPDPPFTSTTTCSVSGDANSGMLCGGDSVSGIGQCLDIETASGGLLNGNAEAFAGAPHLCIVTQGAMIFTWPVSQNFIRFENFLPGKGNIGTAFVPLESNKFLIIDRRITEWRLP